MRSGHISIEIDFIMSSRNQQRENIVYSISQNVTSDAVVSRELYCVMGCNEALNTYFQKLRGEYFL